MIRKLLFLSLIFDLLFLVSCASSLLIPVNSPICAHRGIHTTAAEENSLSAYQKAVLEGVEWAEMDIWCTKDKKTVLTHDRSLKRCHGVDVNVDECTLDELRNTYHLSKEELPEFNDVWSAVKGKINLQIEIKDPDVVPFVLDFFDTEKCYSSCYVISFDSTSLQDLKNSDSSIVCGFLSDTYDTAMLSLQWADFLALNYRCVTQKTVDDIHYSGKNITVWTVNDTKNVLKFDSYGVDGITTDYPLKYQRCE